MTVAARAAQPNPSSKDRIMTPAFNPIDYSSDLEAAGVDKSQAAVHAKALSKVLADVAYTHDLVKLEGNLRKEIQHSEEKLSTQIESVRTDLGARIDVAQAGLNAKMDSRFANIDAKFTNIDARFTEIDSKFYSLNVEMVIHRWALGILMAMSGSTLALVVRPLLA